MAGLSAEEPGSSPPTTRPRKRRHPLPAAGGAGSPAERIACAREWVDELCMLGCVRDWQCVRLAENSSGDGGKKQKVLTS